MFVFGKFGVLCFLEAPILILTLLPYYQQTLQKGSIAIQHHLIILSRSRTIFYLTENCFIKYSPCAKTCNMKRSSKIVNTYQPLIIFGKSSILMVDMVLDTPLMEIVWRSNYITKYNKVRFVRCVIQVSLFLILNKSFDQFFIVICVIMLIFFYLASYKESIFSN